MRPFRVKDKLWGRKNIILINSNLAKIINAKISASEHFKRGVGEEGDGHLHVLHTRRGRSTARSRRDGTDIGAVTRAAHHRGHPRGPHRVLSHTGLSSSLPEDPQIAILQVLLPPLRSAKVLALANKILELSVTLTVRCIDYA